MTTVEYGNGLEERISHGEEIPLMPIPLMPKATSLLKDYVARVREEKVPQREVSFLRKLDELDLHSIKIRLMDRGYGEGWTSELADQLTTVYKKFLFLNFKYDSESLVPTKLVDKVWHQHVLNTQKYANDCQELFGYFLHHSPSLEMSEEDAAKLKDSFAMTQNLFINEFGDCPEGGCECRRYR